MLPAEGVPRFLLVPKPAQAFNEGNGTGVGRVVCNNSESFLIPFVFQGERVIEDIMKSLGNLERTDERQLAFI
jgi:hypothetical protein